MDDDNASLLEKYRDLRGTMRHIANDFHGLTDTTASHMQARARECMARTHLTGAEPPDVPEPTEHTLKTWAPFWDAVNDGRKTFEIRRDDRGFKVGDTIALVRVDERHPHEPTDSPPRVLRRRVTYIAGVAAQTFGLASGYVCLGLTADESSALATLRGELEETRRERDDANGYLAAALECNTRMTKEVTSASELIAAERAARKEAEHDRDEAARLTNDARRMLARDFDFAYEAGRGHIVDSALVAARFYKKRGEALAASEAREAELRGEVERLTGALRDAAARAQGTRAEVMRSVHPDYAEWAPIVDAFDALDAALATVATVAPEPAREPARCERCGWPLAASIEEGCTRGNCSMRCTCPGAHLEGCPLRRAPEPPSAAEEPRCEQTCDHGSRCTLPAGHQPSDRHETAHGCICYDPDEVEAVLAMSDEEITAEIRARGEDPSEVAERVRTVLLNAADAYEAATPEAEPPPEERR